MADSNITDVSKMKVIDLRKELKSRGLPSTGDKAELVSRLQMVLSQDIQDEHGDINLDSDEIDSDGVLDEDEKSSHDLLDDSAVESINEELALEDQLPTPPAQTPAQLTDIKPAAEVKPPRTLKRKITMSESAKEKPANENSEAVAKKIVLNRSSSLNSMTPAEAVEKSEDGATNDNAKAEETSNKVKIAASMDAKTRLELRAKRFGLPVKMSDTERKEARKQRFGQNAGKTIVIGGELENNIDKLKKRAERFGQSVSKLMTQVENKEKLEKRKAKFGTVK
ncbi:SAP domain-containing protein [Phthorimaea operculella]|nr:SAP domain-containing protein [Phthorimaea operculella]